MQRRVAGRVSLVDVDPAALSPRVAQLRPAPGGAFGGVLHCGMLEQQQRPVLQPALRTAVQRGATSLVSAVQRHARAEQDANDGLGVEAPGSWLGVVGRE